MCFDKVGNFLNIISLCIPKYIIKSDYISTYLQDTLDIYYLRDYPFMEMVFKVVLTLFHFLSGSHLDIRCPSLLYVFLVKLKTLLTLASEHFWALQG